jgi:hypothetical protein
VLYPVLDSRQIGDCDVRNVRTPSTKPVKMIHSPIKAMAERIGGSFASWTPTFRSLKRITRALTRNEAAFG